MIAAMTPDEALAIARLRQWACDRTALASAKTVDYTRTGWAQRKASAFDARLVRCIDFGRALATLPAEEQTALILRYRDRETDTEISRALQCSVRKISYLVPAARRNLAAVLDKLDLL